MSSESLILRDKKEIATFLNVSIRTIDRYIQKYNLSEYLQNNHKVIDLSELLIKINGGDLRQVETTLDNFRQFEVKFINQNNKNTLFEEKKTSSDKLRQVETTSDNQTEKEYTKNKKTSSDKLRQSETKILITVDELSNLTELKKEAEIYKKLYTESLKELQQKQERLEGATYRVGQLESQVKQSVPLLEYRQKEEEVIQLKDNVKKNELQYQKKLFHIKKELQESKLMKNIYIFILLSVLVFLPILIIYYQSVWQN